MPARQRDDAPGRHRAPEPQAGRPGPPVIAVLLVVLAVAVVATTAWWAAGGNDPGTGPADSDPTRPSATAPTSRPTGSPDPTTTTPAPPTYTVPARPGTPAGSQAQAQTPHTVTLPSGTSVPVEVASTSPAGLLEVPDDITAAGWWDGGARLGDAYGAMVLASHVDSTRQGIGPFAELLGVSSGDRVTVTSSGLTQRFGVATVDLVPKAELETSDAIFSTHGATRLVLITCAGPFDQDRGGYQDLAVVTAAPVGPTVPVGQPASAG
jgi:hypothetical protein